MKNYISLCLIDDQNAVRSFKCIQMYSNVFKLQQMHL
jgi:hypothetical protein